MTTSASMPLSRQACAALVGFGQVVNGAKNEELSYQFALDEAQKAGDEKSIAVLKRVGPPVMGVYKGGFDGMMAQRRNRLCGRLKFRLCGNRERNLGHRLRRGFLRNGEGYLSRRLVPGERDCIRVRLPSSHRCRRSVLCGALCDGARLSRCGLCFLGLVNLFRQTRFLGTAGFFRQTRFLGAAGLFRQTCFFGAPRGLYGALACGGFFGQALLHGGVEINGLPLAFNGRLFGLRRLLYRARRGDGRGGDRKSVV